LRRGLPLRRARAALVTNVASDHLGQYGVNTLEALTEVKFVVRKALAEDGVLVLNADDDGLVDYMEAHPQNHVCWFSLDKHHPRIQQHIKQYAHCCYAESGNIVYFDGHDSKVICSVDAIPMTMGGAALHNIRNALGAVGVASAMGYSIDQIQQGLTRFNSNQNDNPGRLNTFELESGVRIVIDFAHNAHSVEAVTNTVSRMPAREKWALFGSAGDRSDEEIAAIATGVCRINPEHVVIVELEGYLRGRKTGEIPEILKQASLDSGLTENQLSFADSPMSGVKLALSQMQADDLGLFLVLSDRDEVLRYLNEL